MKSFEHGPKYGRGRCAALGDARVADRWMIILCVVLKVITLTVRRLLVDDKYCRNVLLGGKAGISHCYCYHYSRNLPSPIPLPVNLPPGKDQLT